jgi:hypothetical protein
LELGRAAALQRFDEMVPGIAPLEEKPSARPPASASQRTPQR